MISPAANWRKSGGRHSLLRRLPSGAGPPNKSADPLDILAYNVMATMVVRLREGSGIPEQIGLHMLHAFPELRRDPDWLSKTPPDMTPVQWAMHLRYQDEELDAWVRRGSGEAVAFATSLDGTQENLADLVLAKRFYRQVGSIMANSHQHWRRAKLQVSDDNWAEDLREANLRLAAVSVDTNRYRTKLFDWQQISDPVHRRDRLRAAIGPSEIPPSSWTPAYSPIELDGHRITCVQGELNCSLHKDYWCRSWIQAAEKQEAAVLTKRLQERLASVIDMEISTPKFNWNSLDLAPSFVGRMIHPEVAVQCIQRGLDGPTTEFWLSQGLTGPSAIQLANFVTDDLEDTTPPQIVQAINGAISNDSDAAVILQADALTPGLAAEAIQWFCAGWSWAELSRKFREQSLASGRAVLGAPEKVAKAVVTFKETQYYAADTIRSWAVPQDWDMDLRPQPEVDTESLAL